MSRDDLKNKKWMDEEKERLRILIYEPEEGSREFLSEAFRKEHEVILFQPEGEELNIDLDMRRFDLLIIDPEHDEVIKKLLHMICQYYPGESFWVIVTSDKDELELGLKDLKHQKIILIPKPYDLDVIEKSVHQIAKWKAEKKRASKGVTHRLARFLGFEA